MQLSRLTIDDGGLLNIQESQGHDVTELDGEGTLRLSTGRLPAGNLDSFTSSSGGTVIFDGEATLPAQQSQYRNLVLNNAITQSTAITVYENLQLTSGATLTAGNDWTIGGQLNNEGQIEANRGVFTFNGAAQTQEITGNGSSHFYELQARDGGGKLSLSGDIAIESALDLTGDTLILNDSRLYINRQLIGNGWLEGNQDAQVFITGLGDEVGTLRFTAGFEQLSQLSIDNSNGSINPVSYTHLTLPTICSV